jgi:PAS domain-containing protein
MKLLRFLSTFGRAAVGWLGVFDPAGKEDRRSRKRRRLSGLLRDEHRRAEGETRQPAQTIEARLLRRIEQLEAASSELKGNEQVLREREKRFHGMLRSISDLITVIGADGTVRYENELAVERLRCGILLASRVSSLLERGDQLGGYRGGPRVCQGSSRRRYPLARSPSPLVGRLTGIEATRVGLRGRIGRRHTR